MPPSRALTREEIEDRRHMGSIYSYRYYRKYGLGYYPSLPRAPNSRPPRNRLERNEQTRARMARLCAQDATVSPEVLAARLEAHREAARKYREKCAPGVFYLRTSL